MDPLTCCLLGICCPPLQRRTKVAAHFESLGLDAVQAEIVAVDLITRFDALLTAGTLAHLIDAVKKHHKE